MKKTGGSEESGEHQETRATYSWNLIRGDALGGLRVATMHRVKGLEYDTMVIAGVTDDMMPFKEKVTRFRDEMVRREARLMERALLYVALTRARKSALMTAHGRVSAWLGMPASKIGP